MKARNLTAKHLGQRFKLDNPYPPGGTLQGGLSDYEHFTATPGGGTIATYIWLNGVQLKLHPDTALTFTTKETK